MKNLELALGPLIVAMRLMCWLLASVLFVTLGLVLLLGDAWKRGKTAWDGIWEFITKWTDDDFVD